MAVKRSALVELPPQSNAFGTGWIPSKVQDTDRWTTSLLGAPSSLPKEASLASSIRHIHNQGGTNGCVGHATGGAIDTRLRCKNPGVIITEPSSAALYTGGRGLMRASEKDALVDMGSDPTLVLKFASEHGVPSEEAWPFDPSKVNDELPWDVHQQASAAKVTGFARVSAQGPTAGDSIMQTIVHEFPMLCGIVVTDAFRNYDGKGLVPAAIDTVSPEEWARAPRHFVYFVGYTMDGNDLIVVGVNSWGTGWGDKGFFYVRVPFFKDTSDLIVVSAERA